jgi:hypothetical protein
VELNTYRCQKWTPTGLAAEVVSAPFGTRSTLVAWNWVDVNGDGKADICVNATCTLSTGTGFGETIAGPALNYTPGLFVNEPQWIDINGDGKLDFCYRYAGVFPLTGECILFNGTAFTDRIVVTYSTGQPFHVVDVNGDGRADFCTDTYPSASPWRSTASCQPYAGRYPDLLLGITDGLGATASLSYKPISDISIYVKGIGSTYPTVER